MSSRMMIAVLLSIALAVGAPLVSALNMAQKFQDYPSIRVDIEPYDPRDLFYGHYLRFAIAWNWGKEAAPQQAQTYAEERKCLCVGEGENNPTVSVQSCPPKGDVLLDCKYTLRGKSWNASHFDNGVNRYYVDETIALPLEHLFTREKRKFTLDLHVTPDGKSLPGQLYIDDVPLKEFLAKNGGKVPQTQQP